MAREFRTNWYGLCTKSLKEGKRPDRASIVERLKHWALRSRNRRLFTSAPRLVRADFGGGPAERRPRVLSADDGKYVLGQFSDGGNLVSNQKNCQVASAATFMRPRRTTMPPARRRIQIGWGGTQHFMDSRFNQQMKVPV